jgi:uncharacterized protein (DUF697 family)
VDLAAVSGAQLKMLAELSSIYGVPFEQNRGKALIGSLIGSIVPGTLAFGTAGSLLKSVPVVGALAGVPAMLIFCGASTCAVGKVFIQHFESGGTFLTFDPEQVRDYFKAQFEDARNMATRMEGKKRTEAPA